MSKIRNFTPDDIPQTADLILKSFSFAKKMDKKMICSALDEILFHNPWTHENLPSLVYENSDGNVKGFLGVSPRRMKFRNKTVKVAITHNFVVEPGSHSTIAGYQLFKTLLNDSQDLVISGSAGDVSKYFMEKIGGNIGFLYSFGWKLPLNPLQYGLKMYCEERKLSGLFKLLKPAARTGDFLAGRLFGAPFRYKEPEGFVREIASDEIVNYQCKFSSNFSLQPHYTPENLQWILDVAGKAKHLGELKCLGMYNSKRKFLGWTIFYLNPGGSCEVLQMHAKQGRETQVMELLVYYTWQHGAIEMLGRIEPSFMRALSQSWSIYVPGRMWMIMHGKDPEIVSAICRGDAFISRLEDDIWLL